MSCIVKTLFKMGKLAGLIHKYIHLRSIKRNFLIKWVDRVAFVCDAIG